MTDTVSGCVTAEADQGLDREAVSRFRGMLEAKRRGTTMEDLSSEKLFQLAEAIVAIIQNRKNHRVESSSSCCAS